MHRPPHYGLHPPYAAVCRFRRMAGRPDNGNYLESWEVRGNMQVAGEADYIIEKSNIFATHSNAHKTVSFYRIMQKRNKTDKSEK